ncbi:MAG TPA: hypothetical protein DD670_08850 [Planctomycetaceae bacterium]|nr:hypothetical protein [Planctomycetaceae bacterium]
MQWIDFKGRFDYVTYETRPLVPIYSSTALTLVTVLMGDANLDLKVNEFDAIVLSKHWLMTDSAQWTDGDFNGDGLVNAVDASILAAHWGLGASEASAVPEPGVITILVLGMAMLLVRRGR